MNADDKQKQKAEITDLGEKMIKDIFPKSPPITLNPFEEALKRAKKAKQIVHTAGCKIVRDANGYPDPRTTKKIICDMFEESFKTWNKEELMFYMVMTFTKMELADLGIPDV